MRKLGRKWLSFVLVLAVLTTSVIPGLPVWATQISDVETTTDSSSASGTTDSGINDGESGTKQTDTNGSAPQGVITDSSPDDSQSSESTKQDTSTSLKSLINRFLPVKDGSGLNYVVVTSPTISTGEEQSILLSIGDGTKPISDAKLTYHRESDNASFVAEVSQIKEDAFVFTIQHKKAEKTSYHLDKVTYYIDNQAYDIDFMDLEIDAFYGVNIEVDADPDFVVDGTGEVVPPEEAKEADDTIDEEIAEYAVLDENGDEIACDTIEEAMEVVEEIDLKEANNICIALDPGHGGTDGGASRYGYYERNIVLRIAEFCKAELEQYPGVKVVMTRTDNSAANIDRATRTRNAISMGANVIVSFHINAVTSTAANGVEIWVPANAVNPGAANASRALASQILNQLVSLGLNNRGLKDTDARKGLGMIVYPQQYGIPGILIEHAFISNPSDFANYLSNDTQYKKLGVADATGIAKYYGLQKEYIYPKGSGKITSDQTKDPSYAKLTATGLEKAYGLKFKVWNETNGKSKAKLYTAKKSGKEWSVNIPYSDHGTTGKYFVETWVYPRYASVYMVNDKIDTDVEPADASRNYYELKEEDVVFDAGEPVDSTNYTAGILALSISDIKSTYGFDSVKVDFWSKDDLTDKKTVTATKQSDGSYKAAVDIASYGYKWGNYHAKLKVYNKLKQTLEKEQEDIALTKPIPTVTATSNSKQTSITVEAFDVPGAGGKTLSSVKIGVWTKTNEDAIAANPATKSNLVWYTATKKTSGDQTYYQVAAPISTFKHSGLYYAKVRAYYANQTNEIFEGEAQRGEVEVLPPTTDIEIPDVNNTAGTFQVRANAINSKAGVSAVQLKTWPVADPKASKTYTASLSKDKKTATAKMDVYYHKLLFGEYQSQLIITEATGTKTVFDVESVTLNRPRAYVRAEANQKHTKVMFTANDVPGAGGKSLTNVKIGVWTQKNDEQRLANPKVKSNLKWYTATKATVDGKVVYQANVPVSTFKHSGKYYGIARAYFSDNSQEKIEAEDQKATFDIIPPTANFTFANVNDYSGRFTITASNIDSKSGVKSVSVKVWSLDNPKAVKTYTAAKQKDGTFKATGDIYYHKYLWKEPDKSTNTGKYQATVSFTENTGTVTTFEKDINELGISNDITCIVEKPHPTVSSEPNAKETNIYFRANKIPGAGGSTLKQVKIGVWQIDENGKNLGTKDKPYKWYNATKKTIDGQIVYQVAVPVSTFKRTGMYYARARAYYKNNKDEDFLLADQIGSYEVIPPTSESAFVNANVLAGTFQIQTTDIVSKSGAKTVQVKTWPKSDPKAVKTYTSTISKDKLSAVAKADVAYHKVLAGEYTAQVYLTENTGTKTLVNEFDYTVEQPVASATITKNAAETKVTVTSTNIWGTGGKSLKSVQVGVIADHTGDGKVKKWYTAKAVKLADGTTGYQYTIPVSDIKQSGIYHAATRATYSTGATSQPLVLEDDVTVEITPPTANLTIPAEYDGLDGKFRVSLNQIESVSGVKTVQIAAWKNDDKSDRYIYATKKDAEGNYYADIDVAYHKGSHGEDFKVAAVITEKNGAVTYVDEKSMNLIKPTATLSGPDGTLNEAESIANLSALHLWGTTGTLKTVQFGVYTAADKKDIKWFTAKATKQGDGDVLYSYDMKITEFKKSGDYHVIVRGTYAAKTKIDLETFDFRVTPPEGMISSVAGPSTEAEHLKGDFKVTTTGIISKNGIKSVQVAAQVVNNNKTKYTYTPQQAEDGTYYVNGNAIYHKYATGTYTTSLIVTEKNGAVTTLDAGKTFAINPPKMSISRSLTDNHAMSFSVTNVLGTDSTLKSVQFEVWSANGGQNDLRRITAKRSGVTFSGSDDTANHGRDIGTYYIAVYANYTNGAKRSLGTTSVWVEDKMSIMGTSKTNAAQLARYYRKNNSSYPYQGRKEAPNIDAFCNLYIEECKAEGVRAEVAFGQAMCETNFLKFTGRVPANALNFAGMGAVDSNARAWEVYPSIRTGIRAQVQHLKAYACADGLNNPCVDGRFKYVQRGCAPWVEWLGQKENPYGKGWATAVNYGYSLVNNYIRPLLCS